MKAPVQQASLEYRKAYIQQIDILHYIDLVIKKDYLNTYVSCGGSTLLWNHVVHYITVINFFLKNLTVSYKLVWFDKIHNEI